jgi:WXG100 family type VII secretion target
MPTPTVRADYAQLTQIAQQFGQAASESEVTLRRLQQNVQNLEGGDWIGQSATRFYFEMRQEVIPAMQRLIQALQNAQQVTRQIEKLMRETEAAVAALFRLNQTAPLASEGEGGEVEFPEKEGYVDTDDYNTGPPPDSGILNDLLRLKLPWWLDVALGFFVIGDVLESV